jgi:hypothetical protein
MGLLSRGLHVTLVRDAIAHLSADAARQMEDAFLAAKGEIVSVKKIVS